MVLVHQDTSALKVLVSQFLVEIIQFDPIFMENQKRPVAQHVKQEKYVILEIRLQRLVPRECIVLMPKHMIVQREHIMIRLAKQTYPTVSYVLQATIVTLKDL